MTSPRLDALAHELWEAPLPPEEFERRLAIALSETEEIERARELCAWFMRRYPTARQRLAYARAKHAAWIRPAGGMHSR